jgi:AraC family transcriptional regulator, regulatory protein of adaptative response / methylated-DNA-[protein]-cysteine methyltransferase
MEIEMNPSPMKPSDTTARLAAATLKDPRWKSVLAKDASADGQFYYSVSTTGVYCRVSCASRIARPENVAFHATQEDARQAGFRPCKRCKPDLAITAATSRTGRANDPTDPISNEIRCAIGECSLGSVLVAQSPRGVCAILLGDDPSALARDLKQRFPNANLVGGDRDLEKRLAQVIGLIESPAMGLELPLDPRGTAFQQRVWQALRRIPAGSTASYTDIATRIGTPKAVRAVAQACAANAVAVAIPCHRVVRSDGALSGYRWGVERKRTLLEREART